MPEPRSSDTLEQCVDPCKLWSLRSVPYIPHIPPFLHFSKYTIVLPNWSRYLANELTCYPFTVVTVSPHSCISFQFWSFSLIPILWNYHWLVPWGLFGQVRHQNSWPPSELPEFLQRSFSEECKLLRMARIASGGVLVSHSIATLKVELLFLS